jgi:hypothetical protein
MREAAHEARMIQLTSLIQQQPVLLAQHLGETTKEVANTYLKTDNQKMIANELYNNINSLIDEVNERTIQQLQQKLPVKLPPDTRPLDNDLYKNLVEYATKKIKAINQQFVAYEEEESEIPPYYRKVINGFYAGYNTFKAMTEDETGSKNLHMSDGYRKRIHCVTIYVAGNGLRIVRRKVFDDHERSTPTRRKMEGFVQTTSRGETDTKCRVRYNSTIEGRRELGRE